MKIVTCNLLSLLLLRSFIIKMKYLVKWSLFSNPEHRSALLLELNFCSKINLHYNPEQGSINQRQKIFHTICEPRAESTENLAGLYSDRIKLMLSSISSH